MEEVIRYEFLKDWLETASKEEIIEKLIQNDDRAKKIENQEQDKNKLINYIAIREDLDFKQVVEKFELGDYK